jgi:hypothetical protein
MKPTLSILLLPHRMMTAQNMHDWPCYVVFSWRSRCYQYLDLLSFSGGTCFVVYSQALPSHSVYHKVWKDIHRKDINQEAYRKRSITAFIRHDTAYFMFSIQFYQYIYHLHVQILWRWMYWRRKFDWYWSNFILKITGSKKKKKDAVFKTTFHYVKEY